MSYRLDQRGLTIVELLVAIIVGGLMTTVITAFALHFWTNTTVLQSDEQTLVARLNAGDYLRGAVNSASGMIIQNDLPDAHTLNADPSNVTGNYWLPIHAIPKTTIVGATGSFTPLVYYNRPSINTSKSIIMNGSAPYQDDVILYLNGTTKQLLSRTIANSSATGNAAKTTCPGALATNACPADLVIADDVASVATRYFSRSGNTIDYTSITDPTSGAYIGPDFPSVEVVEFTLNLSKSKRLHSAVNSTNKTVIRVALRN
jgi:Tfp pilus assembly protein FimT